MYKLYTLYVVDDTNMTVQPVFNSVNFNEVVRQAEKIKLQSKKRLAVATKDNRDFMFRNYRVIYE